MVFSVAFEHRLPDTTSYDAYQTIESWINSQGGKIKEDHRPSLIVATHGRTHGKKMKQIAAWRKDARKTLRFELSQQASDVVIKMHVSPTTPGVPDQTLTARADEARFNWEELLNSLWARFGEDVPVPRATSRDGRPVNWEQTYRNGRIMTYIGIPLTLSGFVGIFFYPTSWIFLVSTSGTVLLVNGLMSIRNARKNLFPGKNKKQDSKPTENETSAKVKPK